MYENITFGNEDMGIRWTMNYFPENLETTQPMFSGINITEEVEDFS